MISDSEAYDLIAAILDDAGAPRDELAGALFYLTGLSFEDFKTAAGLLIHLTVPLKGMEPGMYYRGFARDGVYIVKIDCPVSG